MQINFVSAGGQTFSGLLDTGQESYFLLSGQEGWLAFSCFEGFQIIAVSHKNTCKLKIRHPACGRWHINAIGAGAVNGTSVHNSGLALTADQFELQTNGQMLAIGRADPAVSMTGKNGAGAPQTQLVKEVMTLLGHKPVNTPELLRLVTSLTGEPAGCIPGPDLHPADAEKLWQARLHMEQHLQAPPSLFELARLIGLNDYKLKRDFKKLFGTTVFGYLYEKRMEKAKALLEQERLPVGEIAYLVGYKNPQHFTAAFKKKFGCLPRGFRQPVHHESGL
ncbi:helix-turn-helix domain-containing protein [Pedobacter yulinensis]|nr:AraC family transcriptional regulator [Pedobacter yulinensis]